MSYGRIDTTLRFLCVLICAICSGRACASEYRGQVVFNGLPVHGAVITATEGEKRFIAVTNEGGVFSFPELADGSWSREITMTGFAGIHAELKVKPNAPAGKWELLTRTMRWI